MSLRERKLAAAALVAVASAGGVALLLSGGERTPAPARAPATSSATVREGPLSAAVSQAGTLTYRARPDGAPFSAINQARGIYTRLPRVGDRVACGGALYRVDEKPVLLLCGSTPAYRSLRAGDAGRDVRELNRTLGVPGAAFTTRTATALEALQRRRGLRPTGTLALGAAVVLPEALRVAEVSGRLGAPARPGTPVLEATSSTLQVQVNLDAAEQRRVERGARARVTLPDTTAIRGRVIGFGRVAAAPAGQGEAVSDATISTLVSLEEPARARGLDEAPVGVEIATAGVASALSVPVTALVGRAGGGFAVEAVRPGGRRALVPVRVGLFDTAAGRVAVTGRLRAGDAVAVPAP